MYYCLVFCLIFEVQTRFFRQILTVLGLVMEMQRHDTRQREEIFGTEVQVQTICSSRSRGVVLDYLISRNMPSSVHLIEINFSPINELGEQLVSHTSNLHLSVIEMGQEELSMQNQKLFSMFISRALTYLL